MHRRERIVAEEDQSLAVALLADARYLADGVRIRLRRLGVAELEEPRVPAQLPAAYRVGVHLHELVGELYRAQAIALRVRHRRELLEHAGERHRRIVDARDERRGRRQLRWLPRAQALEDALVGGPA